MVSVYVWYLRRSLERSLPHLPYFGHSSMFVNGAAGRFYISWWPAERDYQHARYAGRAKHHENLEKDIQEEGARPDYAITLTGLDEAKIASFWQNLKLQDVWGLFKLNCATTVAYALRVGGGKTYAPTWENKFASPKF